MPKWDENTKQLILKTHEETGDLSETARRLGKDRRSVKKLVDQQKLKNSRKSRANSASASKRKEMVQIDGGDETASLKYEEPRKSVVRSYEEIQKQAFELFSQGKTAVEVANILLIKANLAERLFIDYERLSGRDRFSKAFQKLGLEKFPIILQIAEDILSGGKSPEFYARKIDEYPYLVEIEDSLQERQRLDAEEDAKFTEKKQMHLAELEEFGRKIHETQSRLITLEEEVETKENERKVMSDKSFQQLLSYAIYQSLQRYDLDKVMYSMILALIDTLRREPQVLSLIMQMPLEEGEGRQIYYQILRRVLEVSEMFFAKCLIEFTNGHRELVLKQYEAIIKFLDECVPKQTLDTPAGQNAEKLENHSSTDIQSSIGVTGDTTTPRSDS